MSGFDWASLDSPRMTLAEAVEALRDIGADPSQVGDSTTSYTSRCAHPDHHDDNPSMTLGVGRSGDLLVNCFTCAPPKSDRDARTVWLGAVLQRLRDRVPKDPATPKKSKGDGSAGAQGSPVAEYVYTDADGTVLAKKVRLDGGERRSKDFEWQRPYGQRWAKGLGKRPLAALPPYRLPDLTHAGPDAVVLVVEGEKDVDAAWSVGVPATSAAGGAKGALPDDLAVLEGRDVLIVADYDGAGYEHAKAWLDRLQGSARRVRVARAAVDTPGADLSDHLAAGHGIDDLIVLPLDADGATEATWDGDPDPDDGDHQGDERGQRRVVLTPASAIRPRRVKWLWDGRLALGTLGLLAGPEGLGKSTIGYWVAARVTRGSLAGEYHGQPKAVLVAAAEDSWAHTIVPRLMAAGADLERVYRVEVVTSDDLRAPLTLPRDLAGVRHHAREVDAGLLLLDPLISRLDEKLDTHRDGETRRALEPLARLADDVDLAVLGLIHHNKSGSSDPLTLVMGSKAFTAVARSVHTVVRDPDDDTERGRLFGTPKNNLGRTDLPVLRFTIEGTAIDTDDGPTSTGRVEWTGEADGSIGDAVRRAGESPDERSATAEAGDWLADWLVVEGGRALSSDVKRAGAAAGHSVDSLKRARRRIGVDAESVGFPRRTYWVLRETAAQSEQAQSEHSRSKSGESPKPALTAPTGDQSAQSVQSEQSEGPGPTLLRLDDPADPWDWASGSIGAEVAP